MKNIFLSPTDTELLLEPKEDTLYILPNIPSISLTLDLRTPMVSAVVVGLSHAKEDQLITIKQNHLAPHTQSHVLLKSLVAPEKNFSYQGNVYIAKEASESSASQEVRGLLLGEEARFKAVPSLEILPKNVTCRHKASSAPASKDSLFTLQTRGLHEAEAKELLQTGFLKTGFDTLRTLGVPEKNILQLEKNFSYN